MSASLDALSKNLIDDQCKNLRNMYSGEQFKLIRRKGVFSYEYIDSVGRLNDNKLPSKPAFYSKLSGSDISDEDYKHACAAWEEFKCKTLGDYLEVYNKSDVLILADVFENFRNLCMREYELDPAWYYTVPGLAWHAALRCTGGVLELISDVDMLLMVQVGIRGGMCSAPNRRVKANNKYMEKAYNPKQHSKFITYLDANNLYRWAMSQPLPTHGFEWMSDDWLKDWRNMPNGEGCTLEVDLEYDKKLHDLHNDFPLAPENKIPPGSIATVKKLISDLNNKEKYVVHHQTLKIYERLGLKVTRVHRGIKYCESPWLKPYIDKNTTLRTGATNNFEKDLFKLLNNSVFGKTIQNVEKYIDMKLVCDRERAIKLSAKTNFEDMTFLMRI